MNWVSVLFSALQTAATQAGSHHAAGLSDRKKLRNARILAWLGLVIFLAGLGVAAFGVVEIRSGLASRSWPRTTGRIVESNVVEVPQPYGETFHPIVRYEYRADGAAYVGKRISFHTVGASREMATAVVSKYPAGASVMVHYSPADPSDSVLEPGMTARQCVWTGALMSFLWVAGLGVMWLAAGMRRSALRALDPPAEDPDNPYRAGGSRSSSAEAPPRR